MSAAAWPSGCHDRGSCEGHGRCGYTGCPHQGRDIAPEISAALAGLAAETVIVTGHGPVVVDAAAGARLTVIGGAGEGGGPLWLGAERSRRDIAADTWARRQPDVLAAASRRVQEHFSLIADALDAADRERRSVLARLCRDALTALLLEEKVRQATLVTATLGNRRRRRAAIRNGRTA